MVKKTRELYSSIDIAKFFFSICIIVLHTGVYTLLPYNFPYLFEKCVLRLAVPFFFCASGFLFEEKLYFSNIEEYKVFVKKYIMRLLRPLIFFESINIILESIKMRIQGIETYEIIIDNIKHICFYPYGALWYIQACIVGIILAYPFIINRKINLALVIGFIGYLFALLSNNYYFLTDNVFDCLKDFIDSYLHIFISARNGIFVGFFMLLLGVKTYDLYIETRISKNKKGLLYFCIFFYFVYIVEIISLFNLKYADDGALYFSHIAFIPLFLLNLVICRMKNEKTVILRNLSTGIYLLHRIIISFLFIITYMFGVSFSVLTNFVVVFSGSMMICLIVYKTNNKFACSLLK